MEDLYKNIKKFREIKNLTREQVASKIGMSVSGYSKIERGEVDLTISRVEEISKILNIEIEKLMNFDVSQIFNVSNNKIVQGVGKAENNHFHNDDYKEKYIIMLEEENKRLKAKLQ